MRPRSQRRLFAAVAAVALIASATALSASAHVVKAGPATDRAASPPASKASPRSPVDRNGDRITDLLAHRMAAATRGKRFDVVVTFQNRASLTNATRSVPGLAASVHRTFGLIAGFDASLTARQDTVSPLLACRPCSE